MGPLGFEPPATGQLQIEFIKDHFCLFTVKNDA